MVLQVLVKTMSKNEKYEEYFKGSNDRTPKRYLKALPFQALAFLLLFVSPLAAQVTLDATSDVNIRFGASECLEPEVFNATWVLDGDLSQFYDTALVFYSEEDLLAPIDGRVTCPDWQFHLQGGPGFQVPGYEMTNSFGESIGANQNYEVALTSSELFALALLDPSFDGVCSDDYDESFGLCLYIANNSDVTYTNVQSFGISVNADMLGPEAATINSVEENDGSVTVSIAQDDDDRSYVIAAIIECFDDEGVVSVADEEDPSTEDGSVESTVTGAPSTDSFEDDNDERENDVAPSLLDLPTIDEETCPSTGTWRTQRFEEGDTLTLDELQSNQGYYVVVFGEDDLGNIGEASQGIVVTPSIGQSYLELLSQGSVEENSVSADGCDCSTGSTSGWVLLALLALMCLRVPRGKRCTRLARTQSQSRIGTLLSVGLFVVTIAWSGQSEARRGQVDLMIHGGPYLPNLDESTGSPNVAGRRGLYDCMFGNQNMPQIGFESAWHLADINWIGSFKLGLGVRFAQTDFLRQKDYSRSMPDTWNLSSGCPSEDDFEDVNEKNRISTLMLVPSLTYWADPLLDRFAIPIFPYARVGLNAVNYFFTRDGEFDRRSSTHKPYGLRFGYEFAIGAMFSIDWLDLVSAWDSYNGDHEGWASRKQTRGFQHLFLNAEVVFSEISNFSSSGLNFSQRFATSKEVKPYTFNIGVTFEFW